MPAPADSALTGERALISSLARHLDAGETVRWAATPDWRSVLRTKRFLWWIGVPWLGAVLLIWLMGWVSGSVLVPFALAGAAFAAGPFVILFETLNSIYAITSRRLLIVHDGMRPSVVSLKLDELDRELEVLETGGGAGHVYFASNLPARMRDTDYTGKLAFRDVANARDVATILDAVRGKRAS
jgi:hypothetical protein